MVVLRFKATLTVKAISWRSVTHMCFLAFSHQYLHMFFFFFFPKPPTTFPICFCRVERRKYAGKKVRLHWGSNSLPPGHESDTLTTEPLGRANRRFHSRNKNKRNWNCDSYQRFLLFHYYYLPFQRCVHPLKKYLICRLGQYSKAIFKNILFFFRQDFEK